MTAVMPAATPLRTGRSRWRLTLHNRAYAINLRPRDTSLGELVDARAPRLEKTWNAPATLSFSLDGRSQAAALIRELQHDICAWRYDEGRGIDRFMYRGVITQSQDQITAENHVTTYSSVDYLGMLARRYVTSRTPLVYTQVDQDNIVNGLLTVASSATSAGGTSFSPGSYLPLQLQRVNGDGTVRAANSGQLRDRTYYGGQEVGEAIDNLAASLPPNPQPGQNSSFDYDVFPSSDGSSDFPYLPGNDVLRVFWPSQGVTRTDMAFVYGAGGVGAVSTVDRTINSSAYANYVRVLGNNGASDPAVAQLIGEAWNADASAGVAGSIGLWAMAENASDVTLQNTLTEQAQGDLAYYSTLMPTYTLGLRPGVGYAYGYPFIGDTVPLIIQSGRLNVSTTVRVLGISYDLNDDALGGEDVGVTVGRPAVTLAGILAANRRDINALARR